MMIVSLVHSEAILKKNFPHIIGKKLLFFTSCERGIWLHKNFGVTIFPFFTRSAWVKSC